MGGEESIAVAIVLKGAGLIDKLVDDVPVLNQVSVLTAQARHGLDFPATVVDVQMLALELDLNLFTDQTAVDRVGVVVHPAGWLARIEA
jgi:hypothetical protein